MDAINKAGKLLKLKIIGYQTKKQIGRPVGVFNAYYNPESYSVTNPVQHCHKAAAGSVNGDGKFVWIPPKTYSFDLLLDGTGASGVKIPVPAMIASFQQTCYNYIGDSHSTPFLILLWGTMVAKCVLSSSTITYDLFDPIGIPLRAKISCTFKTFETKLLQIAKSNKQSPDLTHLRIVKQGDTLHNLCHEIYGSSEFYLRVAKVNDLVNYRQLKPGVELFFPPLEKTN